MMKYVFLLAFLGVFVYATFFDASAKFDFATADRDARVAWLSDQTTRTQSKLNGAVRLKYGYFTKTQLIKIEVTSGAKVRATLRVGDVTGSWVTSTQKREIQTVLCSTYLTLPMARQNVPIGITLVIKRDTFSGRLVLDHRTCGAEV